MSNFCKNCGKKIANGALCDGCGSTSQAKIYQPTVNLGNQQVCNNTNSTLNITSSSNRLVNYILDIVCIYLFSFSLGVFLFYIGQASIIDSVNERVLGVFLIIIFYLFFEGIWQKTPAKWITKTKVVMKDGTKPGFGRILVRTLSRIIPLEQFSFFGKNPVGWHDKISGTFVVSDK